MFRISDENIHRFSSKLSELTHDAAIRLQSSTTEATYGVFKKITRSIFNGRPYLTKYFRIILLCYYNNFNNMLQKYFRICHYNNFNHIFCNMFLKLLVTGQICYQIQENIGFSCESFFLICFTPQ